jgi:hypothetical protein
MNRLGTRQYIDKIYGVLFFHFLVYILNKEFWG